MNEAYLEHYGVKGMKWGVRKSRQERQSSDHRRATELKKKRLSEMSNQELNTLNQRMRLENEYRSLKTQQSVVNRGEKKVKAILAVAGTATAAYKLLSGPGGRVALKGAKFVLASAYLLATRR